MRASFGDLFQRFIYISLEWIILIELIECGYSISHCSCLRGAWKTENDWRWASRMHATNLNLAQVVRLSLHSSRYTTARDHPTCWFETIRQRHRALVQTFELDVIKEDSTRSLQLLSPIKFTFLNHIQIYINKLNQYQLIQKCIGFFKWLFEIHWEDC